jgi:hypothetical protein
MLKSGQGKVLGVPQNSRGDIFYPAKSKIWLVTFKPKHAIDTRTLFERLGISIH